MIDYTRLPEHMQDSMKLYVEHGVPPGSFARAALEDSLVGVFTQADWENWWRMFDWASWLYNDAPADCWGSREAVQEWIERGGLFGLEGENR